MDETIYVCEICQKTKTNHYKPCPHAPLPTLTLAFEQTEPRIPNSASTHTLRDPYGHLVGEVFVGNGHTRFAKAFLAAPEMFAAHCRNLSLDVDAIRKEGRLVEVLRQIVADAKSAIATIDI